MYSMVVTRRFTQQLKRLPEKVAKRILRQASRLAEDPFLGKPLRGFFVRIRPDLTVTLRSLRVGDYRVIYVVDSLTRTVYLITVRHRKHVYEKL